MQRTAWVHGKDTAAASIPQGLKPTRLLPGDGSAEAEPFRNT